MSTNPIPSLPTDPGELGADERRLELEQARRLAERYRLEFVDMDTFRIDQDLFRSIPADLMLRYGFVPYHREGKHLVIVVSDPTDLQMIDELGVLLSTPIKVMVGARSAIESILKKSESSQRVLEDATESFQLQLLKEEETARTRSRWSASRATSARSSASSTRRSTRPSSAARATSTSKRRTMRCT